MHQENEYNIIDCEEDFNGWRVLEIEPWKPGVYRVYLSKISSGYGGTFMIVYAEEEYTKKLEIYRGHASS